MTIRTYDPAAIAADNSPPVRRTWPDYDPIDDRLRAENQRRRARLAALDLDRLREVAYIVSGYTPAGVDHALNIAEQLAGPGDGLAQQLDAALAVEVARSAGSARHRAPRRRVRRTA